MRSKIMLDSGAYSAWSHNERIDVNDYIKFVKRVKDQVWRYVNLDVIPGSIDRVRTREEVEESAKLSYQNLERMRDAGLRPLPVFHQGESFSWLEKLVEDGEDYIGVSTAKNQTNAVQERWLDRFWTAVTDNKGRPIVKVHGFGSAHVSLLKRLPWYSVDSAGWSVAAAYGQLYVPPYANGKPRWLRNPQMVWVCDRDNQHTSKSSELHQFLRYGPALQETVRRFLEDEVGCSIGEAKYEVSWRWRALITYYLRVCEQIRGVRFSHPKPDFVQQLTKIKGKPVKIEKPIFVFSTSCDKNQYEALCGAGASYHLLSYYLLRKRPEIIERYRKGQFADRIATGIKPEDQHFGNRRYRDMRARSLIKRIKEYENGATE